MRRREGRGALVCVRAGAVEKTEKKESESARREKGGGGGRQRR
jgi:hypothetical protein